MLDNPNSRRTLAHLVDPIARLLIKARITPDALTWFGSGATLVISVVFLARGDFLLGAVLFGIFGLVDLLDGTMARISGKSSRWGALLDSTLDRVGDAAIFGGLLLYYAHHDQLLAVLTGVCLVSGGLVPYVKAKAESLGIACDGGIAERAERITTILVTTGLAGLGLPYVGAIGLWLIAVASIVTFGQRMAQVWRNDV